MDTPFKGPVKSRNGLGIGLFQAAKQAEQMGYKLSLCNEERLGVCFELRQTGALRKPPHPLRRRSDLVGPYAHLVDSEAPRP